MAKKEKKEVVVYVYHDGDHGDIEVFDSFEKAVEHTTKCWGEPEWEDPDGNGCGEWHDMNSDYVTITRKTVK